MFVDPTLFPELMAATTQEYISKGNRICFLEILVGRISHLPVVIVTNACSKVLLSKADYQAEINNFKGTFVLPAAREELKYVFSRFGRGTLLAKKTKFVFTLGLFDTG